MYIGPIVGLLKYVGGSACSLHPQILQAYYGPEVFQ